MLCLHRVSSAGLQCELGWGRGELREKLVRVRLDRIHPHPVNVNVMEAGFLAKLRENTLGA